MRVRAKNLFINSILACGFTFAGPTFADGSESAKSINDITARATCYKNDLEDCKTKANAAMASVNQGGEAGVALAKDKDQKRNGAIVFGEAQKKGSADLKDISAKCQKKADDCERTCAVEAKARKDAITNCKEDYKKLQEFLQSGSAGLLANSLDTASVTDAIKADGPSGTNSTNTTAPEKPSKSGDSSMGSMMGAVAPMAMVGAMMAMKASQDDDKKQQQELQQLQQQQQLALAANSALQPNGTIDCSKPDAGYYADCNTYLMAACQQTIANASFGANALCTTFAGRFCGTSSGGMMLTPYSPSVLPVPTPAAFAPNAAFGTTGGAPSMMPMMGQSGEGRATSFCSSALAFNYCAAGGRAQCPSCQNLATMNSSVCQSTPGACIGQTTPQAIVQARSTCPDDPLFANPANALVANAPAVLPLPGTIGVTPSPAVTAVITGGSGGAPAVLPAASTGFQAASIGGRSLATAGPASDITGQYGPSVFSTGTQTISKMCQSGQLNCP